MLFVFQPVQGPSRPASPWFSIRKYFTSAIEITRNHSSERHRSHQRDAPGLSHQLAFKLVEGIAIPKDRNDLTPCTEESLVKILQLVVPPVGPDLFGLRKGSGSNIISGENQDHFNCPLSRIPRHNRPRGNIETKRRKEKFAAGTSRTGLSWVWTPRTLRHALKKNIMKQHKHTSCKDSKWMPGLSGSPLTGSCVVTLLRIRNMTIPYYALQSQK